MKMQDPLFVEAHQTLSTETHGPKVLEAWRLFLTTPVDTQSNYAQKVLKEKPEQVQLKRIISNLENIPAIQAVLSQYELSISQFQSFEDLKDFPVTDKASYFHHFPMDQMAHPAALADCDTLAVSSGTSGIPTFWPRGIAHELMMTQHFEQLFYHSFQAHQKRTLVVVCFTLGTWVGGLYTTNCCRYLSAKGYPLMVVTPGTQLTEIFRVVQHLSPSYDQTVLCGYPPFLREVIEQGRLHGVDWQCYAIRCLMAGEVISESWRTWMADRIGSTQLTHDFVSMYGTADAGVLGFETPISIRIRQWCSDQSPDLLTTLFGQPRLPTLVQYNPYVRHLETIHVGETTQLAIWGDNGLPLFRYALGDHGASMPYAAMLEKLALAGCDVATLLQPIQEASDLPHYPFAFVFGRLNHTVSYFGANIYHEHVRYALEAGELQSLLTGKFIMHVSETDEHQAQWEVYIECAPTILPDEALNKHVQTQLVQHLTQVNSEFQHYVPQAYQSPHVSLWPYGDLTYFPPGVKHRYTFAGGVKPTSNA